MTTNIHGQPLWYGDFSNIRVDSHAAMDIDSSGGCQPPSIGDVRQMVVSEPASGSNQMYSDGQPPSVNDVRRREPSQSEPSCNRYEGTEEHEVEQVYKRGTGIDGDASAGIMFDPKASHTFGVPNTRFNPSDLRTGVRGPPPQQFQRNGRHIRVSKTGAIGRSIDVASYSGYDELKQDLDRWFGIEGLLDGQQGIGWRFVYVDDDNDVLLVGGDPWDEFVNCVQSIRILSPQEIDEMRL